MNAKLLYIISLGFVFLYSYVLWGVYLVVFQVEPGFEGAVRTYSGLEGFITFFTMTLIAPLIETLIFQYLVIKGMTKLQFFSSRLYIPILVSALCFSFSHGYSPYYIAYSFGSGIVLAVFFVVFMKRNQSPFLNTLFLHSIFNLIVFLTRFFSIIEMELIQ